MAKRSPVGEGPYRPLLDPAIISAALTQTATATPHPAPTPQPEPEPQQRQASTPVLSVRAAEPPRPEPAQRQEPAPFRTPPADPVRAGQGSELRVVPTAAPLVEKFDQEKRMLLTRAESAQLDRLVTSLASRVNTQVKLSHVLRALVVLVLNAENELDRRAGEAGMLSRPPNGDPKALKRFEQEIARIIGAALRDAGPLR